MNPCYSGFQVQGTATAPTGMTPSDTQNAAFYSYIIISYNFVKYKYKMKFSKNILRHNKAAAEIHDLSRDKCRPLGAEEKRGTRHLLGCSES